jgi:hypothetical protein
MLTKIDLTEELSYLYHASPITYRVLNVPPMNFLRIDGRGSFFNDDSSRDAVEAVFSLSYALKFAVRRQENIDYALMPLEVLWWTGESSRFTYLHKSSAHWSVAMMQPHYVTESMIAKVFKQVVNKKKLPALSGARLETYDEGNVVQVLRLGSLVTTEKAMAELHEFIDNLHFECTGKYHEIYLSDPLRTPPDRLKTILRQPIRPRGA